MAGFTITGFFILTLRDNYQNNVTLAFTPLGENVFTTLTRAPYF